MEFEIGLLAIGDHEADTFQSEHIADLVGVAHCADSAMHHCHTRKLGRHQHGAFHMHMGIDKARQHVYLRR